MDEGQSIGPPIDAIKQLQPLIESITIPETYRDASLGVGKKAPLLHLTYRSPQGTLTAEQVTRIRQAIIAYLQKEDIHVRE
jgi:phenylalanyl-tRNA synthetase beta subunit